MKRAIFVDRDGTLCEDIGYIRSLDQLIIFPETIPAIKMFNELGFYVIVITNQSGVQRGYYSSSMVDEVNNKIIEILGRENARIDKFYVCLHHPLFECSCRKPKTGLIEEAMRNFDIDVRKSYMIGDKECDIELARNILAKSILVLTGYGEITKKESKILPDYIAKDLYDAAVWIKNHEIK